MVDFLIVRFSSIGDIILTTPVIRNLKNQVKDARIHYLTKESFRTLVDANPYVDRVHVYRGDLAGNIRDLKSEGIDYIIDLHHNARSARVKLGLRRMDFTVRKLNFRKWLLVNFRIDRMPDLHMVDRNMKTIRTFIESPDDRGVDYFIPEGEKVELSTLPVEFRNGYIGLAIGAQHGTKKLPVESLVELCRELAHPVILIGGVTDRDTGEVITRELAGNVILNGCGTYSLHQSASLVKQSVLLITHDTGLMHMGAAFGKTVLSVWGNTVPAFGMYPYGAGPDSVRFEVGGLKCRPCSKIGYEQCPKGHFKCMKEQDPAGIAQMANRLFEATVQ